MKIYLLYYDTDYGSREEWTVDYTPCEVFDDPAKREARIEFIKAQVDEEGEPYEFRFQKHDLTIMTDEKINNWNGDPRGAWNYASENEESSAPEPIEYEKPLTLSEIFAKKREQRGDTYE